MEASAPPAADAPILLLDEATSALDTETEEAVLRNIIRFHPNKAIIISTHRPGALKLCQRIYRIQDGGMEESAPSEADALIPCSDDSAAAASSQTRALEQEAYFRKQSAQAVPAPQELPAPENENGWWTL